MYCLFNDEYVDVDLSYINGVNGIIAKQKDLYSKYEGTQVGDYKVLKVEYDWGKRSQRWKVKCVHCGKEMFVYHPSDWRRGKGRSIFCKCRNIVENLDKLLSHPQPKNERVNYNDSSWIGQEFSNYRIIGYAYRGQFQVECVKCGKKRKVNCGELLNGCVSSCNHKEVNDYSDEKWIGKRNGNLTATSYIGKYFEARCDCGRVIKVRGVDLFKYKTAVCCKDNDCEYSLKHTQNRKWDEIRAEGLEYEHKAFELFEKNGYACEKTPDVGDFGVDFIIHLSKDCKLAIQCKKQKKPAGVRAVQQVFAGGIYYDCDKFAIISATGFTENAITMAAKLGVYLPIHRFELDELYNVTDYTVKLVQSLPTVECVKGTRLRTKWTVNGETKFADDWCKEYGVSRECVNRRLLKGMSIEEALSTPRYNTKVYQVGENRGSLSELCQIYGMIPETVKYRMKHKGMTIEEALLTPISQPHSNKAM